MQQPPEELSSSESDVDDEPDGETQPKGGTQHFGWLLAELASARRVDISRSSRNSSRTGGVEGDLGAQEGRANGPSLAALLGSAVLGDSRSRSRRVSKSSIGESVPEIPDDESAATGL